MAPPPACTSSAGSLAADRGGSKPSSETRTTSINFRCDESPSPKKTHLRRLSAALLAIILSMCIGIRERMWIADCDTDGNTSPKPTVAATLAEGSCGHAVPLNVSDPSTYLPVPLSKDFSWNTMNMPKQALGFLHIPKTGGSSIEIAAAKAGIAWGSCYFRMEGVFVACPPQNQEKLQQNDTLMHNNRAMKIKYTSMAPLWHVPIQYLPVNSSVSIHKETMQYKDPYANQDLFVVVRNPYMRAVSEYYYGNRFVLRSQNDTAQLMNDKLQEILKSLRASGKPTSEKAAPSGYFQHDGHYIPQYDYVYDSSSVKIAQHVVHFEYLTQEFQSLMDAYGLNVSLASMAKVNAGKRHRCSEADLTPETRQLIEDVYEKDFEIGGYKMIEKSMQLM